jgi:hypothetical protein
LVNAVAFSPDGRRVVSGSDDGTLRLWDAATGAALGAPLEGPRHWVKAVAFSPDGRHIVSGSADRTLRLWDAATGAELARFESEAAILAIAAAHDTFAAGDEMGRVRIFEAVLDEAAKARWLARCEAPPRGTSGCSVPNSQPQWQPVAIRLSWWKRLLVRG